MKRFILVSIALCLAAAFFYTPSIGQVGYAYRIAPAAALPANCDPRNGDVVYRTTGVAPLSPAMYACTAPNVWTRILFNGGESQVTGTTTGFVINRTDAGHVHLVVSNTAGSADFGIGAAGEAHIDVAAPGAATNIRFATVDTWSFNSDGTLRSVGVNQAALAGLAPPNGSLIYCSDCTIASPCAGGGTGALAKRLNGAWICN